MTFPPNADLPGGLLAFDPSLCAFGWAYFANTSSGYQLRETGCIRTKLEKGRGPKTQRASKRLASLALQVDVLFQRFSDDWLRCVSECPTGGMGAIPLAQCFGIVTTLSALHGCPAEFVTPRAVKLAATGKPSATKPAVARGVIKRLGWVSGAKTKPEREAETDAVAVALTAWEAL